MKYLIITDKNKGVCSSNAAETLEEAESIQVKLKELYNNRAVITEDIGLEVNLAIVDYVAETVTWNTDKDTADKLAVAKIDKYNQINNKEIEMETVGFLYETFKFKIKLNSISAMFTKLQMAKVLSEPVDVKYISWYDVDSNQHVFDNVSAFESFVNQAGLARETIAQNKCRLKGLVRDAITIQELQLIDINEGWS